MTPPTRPKAAPAQPAKGRVPRPHVGGRPRKAAPPRVPWDEVDRLLVFGESVPCADGIHQATRYPSYRELGERYGCASSVICDHSRKHNCLRRRAENEARTKAKADQKVVELRATSIAFAREDELRVIDGYLAGFEKALADGRVRFDNPSDFNTMMRLKSFLMGGADSRQEVTATLSLEALQARHRQMLRGAGASAAERGIVERHARPLLAEGREVEEADTSPGDAGGWEAAPGQEAEGELDSADDRAAGPPPAAQKPYSAKPSARFSVHGSPEPEGPWDGGGGRGKAAPPPRRAPSWASVPLDPALTGVRPQRTDGAAQGPPRPGEGASPPEAPPGGAAEEPSARRGRSSHDG